MSTEHEGAYCAHKDKMRMAESEARAVAGRLGMTVYRCPECGDWHLATRRGGGKNGKRGYRRGHR